MEVENIQTKVPRTTGSVLRTPIECDGHFIDIVIDERLIDSHKMRRKKTKAMRANMSGEEIDIQSELKQFETDQQAKRNTFDEELAKKKEAITDKINKKIKKIKKEQDKEEKEEEIETLSEAEKSKHDVDIENSKQRSQKTFPLFALHREKTVVNVDITEDQKQAVFNKLVREQRSIHDKIKQQPYIQQEMLRRRLDKSRGKKEMQAKEIMDMSEKQKKEYHKAKNEERDRQLQQMQKKISMSKHRARSRSQIDMGASPIPEDQVKEAYFKVHQDWKWYSRERKDSSMITEKIKQRISTSFIDDDVYKEEYLRLLTAS